MTTRIGLVSDTHIPESQKQLWPQVYKAFEDVDCIFHGGDVHDLALLDSFEEIAPIYCARGNGEDGTGGRPVQPEDPRVRYSWVLDVEDLRVGLTHYISVDEGGPNFTLKKSIDMYFPDETLDVIVFGDTHVELIKTVNGILCVNPGSPTYPHNYDTTYGTLGFLDIDGDSASASVWQITDSGIEPFDWDATPPWQKR
ncbi:MAG: YfcE family phosphodiesterase [Gammaproteobacteria bacterium]|nr:YfcE family phosphodiesterase [Gammaproteobacteria bacterium]